MPRRPLLLALVAVNGVAAGACPEAGDGGGDAPTDTSQGEVAEETSEPDLGQDTAADGAGSDSLADTAADVGPDACRPNVPAGVTLEEDGRFARVVGLPAGEGLLPRGVTVYLPEGFDAGGATRYPVLYMHDGQNLFRPGATPFGEWGVDEAIDELTLRGVVPATLVVGIDNTSERIADYTPTADPGEGGGNAEAYGAWLVDTLKPAIDGLFPTRCEREHTSVGGSSLGGLVSTWLGVRWPTVFGRVAAVSPSYWWDGERLLRDLEDGGEPLPLRWWIDMGSGEGDTSPHDLDPAVAEARRAFAVALARGLELGRDVAYLEALGAAHNESSWRQRLPAILGFLLSDDGFTSFPGEASLSLLPSGEGLYLGPRPHILVVAEVVRGDGPRPGRMTLPASALTAEGPVTLDAHGIATATGVGQVTLGASWGDLVATTALTAHPIGVAPVAFEVQIPASTPDEATVHIDGDLAELGAWDPAAIACRRLHARRARSPELALPVGASFQYRYSLGTLATLEADAAGHPVALRDGGPVPEMGDAIVDLVPAWLGPAR
jgi:predicted alpha/beta superfamily hydrolase